MSVRPPTSKSKTEPYSSIAEKIKSLRERKKKLNPLSPANKKITQQIKKLEQSQKPVSQKFKYTGKTIGDKKTKTGQFVSKPKVLSASDKRKIATKKRDAQSKLKLQQQIKDLKRKGQDVKARKASERLEDIPPVRKPKTYGGELTPKKVVKPVSKVVPKKVDTPVSKVVSDKPTVKSKPKNRLQILKDRGKATSPQNRDYINPRDPKRLEKLRKRKLGRTAVSDMLKARQAKPSDTDIKSGRKAEADRKAAKLKRQAALEAKADPQRPDRRTKPESKTKELKIRAADKKIAPSKLANVTSRRKPVQQKAKTYGGDLIPTKGLQPPSVRERRFPKHEFGDPALGLGPKKPKTKAKTPKKSEEGFLGFKQISGPKDWRGGIREYETPFGNITLDSSQENLTPEQKERKKIGLSYKKGGQIKVPKKKKVGKKKQGYKARKDESIAMRVKKKRTKKQLKASRNESYGKWGKGKGKGKINRSGAALVASSYD